jgi:hypothetical protein
VRLLGGASVVLKVLELRTRSCRNTGVGPEGQEGVASTYNKLRPPQCQGFVLLFAEGQRSRVMELLRRSGVVTKTQVKDLVEQSYSKV